MGRIYPHSVNKIFLSEKNLLHNFSYLSSLNKNIHVVPVLKSNAYGYGLLEVAKILDSADAQFFCVNSFYEAYELYQNNIKTPILVMGYVDPEDLQSGKYPFSYAAYNYSQLQAINEFQRGAKVHIFVDTGMHREGFRLEKLPLLLENLKPYKNVRIDGVMSHFASADDPESQLTQEQIAKFGKSRKIIREHGVRPTWEHIAASAGFLRYAAQKGIDIGNLSRVGKAMYGIDPRGRDKNLRPILKLTSKIVQVKTLKKGDAIGYNETYKAQKDTTIAVLPIGYYDGVDRRLSNRGFMLVDNVRCPIVGRVSMNLTTIDVSKIKNPRVGQEVVVFSSNQKDPNSIENIARLCSTIPYDIAVRLPQALQRVIY